MFFLALPGHGCLIFERHCFHLVSGQPRAGQGEELHFCLYIPTSQTHTNRTFFFYMSGGDFLNGDFLSKSSYVATLELNLQRVFAAKFISIVTEMTQVIF